MAPPRPSIAASIVRMSRPALLVVISVVFFVVYIVVAAAGDASGVGVVKCLGALELIAVGSYLGFLVLV